MNRKSIFSILIDENSCYFKNLVWILIRWKSKIIFNIGSFLVVNFRRIWAFNICWRLRFNIGWWRLDWMFDRLHCFFLNRFSFLLNSGTGRSSSNACCSPSFRLLNSFLLFIRFLIGIFCDMFYLFLRNLFSLYFLSWKMKFLFNLFCRFDSRLNGWHLFFRGSCVPLLDFLVELINHVLYIFQMLFWFPCRLLFGKAFPKDTIFNRS